MTIPGLLAMYPNTSARTDATPQKNGDAIPRTREAMAMPFVGGSGGPNCGGYWYGWDWGGGCLSPYGSYGS